MEQETAQENEVAPAKDKFVSELNQQIWSVVSFEKVEAGSLTYDEASEVLEKLTAKKVSGLCIITDEAAERM